MSSVLGRTIQSMLETELEEQMEDREDPEYHDSRNGYKLRKAAAYVILGINEEGRKEVLSITVGENENAKFWLSVLNERKNRGVQDIFVICADGLGGIREAIAAAYPLAEYQRCIVHMVRNTLKYVADKDKKSFANGLKTSTMHRTSKPF